ncbi:helix-turn-helix domain-containing protein [Amycolatopsis sp. CA-230715]|uniref:helix-turn-helix domain-containing protein n=1 Tax=Amycolatopsis sp. CA-230715 TaxID=2745196 RepID=UPI001C0115A9|nr:helix-turn-helix domain-containing protein [Amycolatopsis sp. CA-230715]QWF77912.1 hypothetical protein HUW46_01305 [Amycolatopsis sp. CA-230715]
MTHPLPESALHPMAGSADAMVQLARYLPSLTDVVITGMRRALPEYAAALDREWARECAAGTVHRVPRRTGDGAEAWSAWVRRFRWMGAAAFAGGRGLLPLYRSYWAGGRAAVRYLYALVRRNALSGAVARACADTVFAVVDEISAESARGYAAARASGAHGRARGRKLLLHRILSGGPDVARSLHTMAAAAEWPLPERVAAVAVEPGWHPDAGEPWADALTDLDGPEPCLLLPGAPGDLPEFEGARTVVGPSVPLDRAADSLHLARRTLHLVRQGALPDRPVTRCDDHLIRLWLLADEELAALTASHALEPLAALTAKQRIALSTTLLAWLGTGGNVGEVARRLGAHPATVRNRLRRLRELFGDRLADPDARFTLEIALCADERATLCPHATSQATCST